MSFSDNLENDLKNLEAQNEMADARSRQHGRYQHERAAAIAAQPFAEKLKTAGFAPSLMTHATRLGHGMRTKVRIMWLGSTLRLQARDHRLELRPTPEGVFAVQLVNGDEVRRDRIDVDRGNPEKLAKKWLETVGPPPPAGPIPPELLQD